jgi:hypothetical protein
VPSEEESWVADDTQGTEPQLPGKDSQLWHAGNSAFAAYTKGEDCKDLFKGEIVTGRMASGPSLPTILDQKRSKSSPVFAKVQKEVPFQPVFA